MTLAAEAGAGVLDISPDSDVKAMLIATVTSPLAEGGIAQTVVEVLGLGPSVFTAEFGGTIAATGSALVTAAALVAAGVEPVMVIATDARADADSATAADGAVACLLASEGDVGTLQWVGSSASTLRDVWRLDGELSRRRVDRSFAKFGIEGSDLDELSASPGGPRLAGVGLLGNAGFLAALLMNAPTAGDPVAASVAAGGLVHRFSYTVGPAALETARRVQEAASSGVEAAPKVVTSVDEFEPFVSHARARREREQDLALEGQRSPETGEVFFPPVPDPEGALEPYRLARHGRVLTHSTDYVFPYGGPITMAVVDCDGGGRFYGQVVEGAVVDSGMKVDFVLRRLHDGGGSPQYFWKVRPAKSDSEGKP